MGKVHLRVLVRLASFIAPALLFFPSPAAATTSYTFTTIADTREFFRSFSPTIPALNQSGEVVFWAALQAGGEGIFTGTGSGRPLTLYDTQGDFSELGIFPTLNNTGQVAFRATLKPGEGGNNTSQVIIPEGLKPGECGIFVGNLGGPATFVLNSRNPCDLTDVSSFLSINDQGAVVFKEDGPRVHDYHLSRILLNNGATLTSVYGPTDLGTTDLPLIVNNSGLVAPYGLPAGATAVLQECGPFTSLNDNGVVACGDSEGVFTINGALVTSIANTQSPFGAHGFFPYSISINNHNTIAFSATLQAGGAGIFTGDGRVTDQVITTGDPLLSSTVVALRFLGVKALNDNGQVTFLALLADGTEGIFRADPLP
jgi:hypothetical protein